MVSRAQELEVPSAPPLADANTGSSPTAPVGRLRRELGEFMLVGGATWLLFPLCWILTSQLGLDPAELGVSYVAFYLAFVINDPHFGVTYLLFYRGAKQRLLGQEHGVAQRVRYLVAGFIVPVVLVAWAAAGLASGSARTVGLMVQLMFLLVGWHYVKQGFGVLTVLSARRGFSFSVLERRVILGHCYAAWAYAWASPMDPGYLIEEQGLVFMSIAHPAGLERLTGIFFGLSSLVLVWLWIQRWRRRQLPPAVPLMGFLITVWLWTVFTSLDPLMIYLIPGLHSLQYLYFVWLLRRGQAKEAEGPPKFGRPVGVQLFLLGLGALLVGWAFFRIGPVVLTEVLPAPPTSPNASAGSAGEVLGPTPYAAALFAFVNIHHYFMDHVIWRRENPETRYLRH